MTAGNRQTSNPYAGALALAQIGLSATLFVWSFPPMRMRPLAWIALVPLLIALRTGSWRRTLGLAGLWGMLAAYGVTDWLPPAIANYYHQPLWLGMALFLTAAFLMGALDYMVFAVLYRSATRAGVRPMALLAAAAWVTAELGRSRILSGNPWGLIGYTQVGFGVGVPPSLAGLPHYAPLAVSQVADLAGVYGVSFVVVAVNAALAECWLSFSRRDRGGGAPVRELLTAGLLVVAAVGYGLVRLGTIGNATALAGAANVGPVPIAVAQGNLDLGSRWSSDLYGRNLDVYLELTEQSASSTPPRIVFWPENAMTFFVDEEPLYRAAIARTLAPLHAQLVAGAPRREAARRDARAPVYFNSAFLLASDGTILGHYDKQHLLPFAEYFPLESLDFMRRTFGRVREFSPGRATALLPTAAGPAGVVICNEAMFPRVARRRVTDGAAFLINLANDSWIPSKEFAEHQFDIVAMRAIELRRFLVRASTSGPSGVIAPSGRTVARTDPFQRGFVRASIEPRFEQTWYARFGDLPAWLCTAVAFVTTVLAVVRRRPR